MVRHLTFASSATHFFITCQNFQLDAMSGSSFFRGSGRPSQHNSDYSMDEMSHRTHSENSSGQRGHDEASAETSPWLPSNSAGVHNEAYGFKHYDKCWWFVEIAVLAGSIVALIAIVLILNFIQDQPLDDWNFYLQPNTVLSLLATTARVALLFPVAACISQLKWAYYWRYDGTRKLRNLEVFDEASRGPLGAAQFFWYIRNIVPAAWLASFVTLLTLGIGPFTQQIVSFRTQNVNVPREVATVSISNNFDVANNVSAFGTTSGLLDGSLQGALFRGIFAMNGQLDFVCPSANCTWSDFSTLALCSDCQDVTQSTRVEQQNCSKYDMPGATKDQNYLQCEKYLFETPDSGVLVGAVGAQNGTYFDGHKWIPRITSTQLVSNTSAPNQATDDWTKVTTINLGTFQWNETWDFETASNMMTTKFTTTQCTISWCLKKYMGVAVVNGAINDFLTSDIDGRVNESDTDYVFVPNAPSSDIGPWQNISDFHISFDLWTQIWQSFYENFNFNMTSHITDEQRLASNPQVFLAFYQNPNTSGVIHDISASMTDRIRHNYNDRFSNGSVLRPVVFVEVNWAWISLPLAAVLLAALVLCLTIWTNYHDRVPLWKSGLLPLLFHGLQGWRREDLYFENRQEMTDKADGMHTRLDRSRDGGIGFLRQTAGSH